MSVNWSELRNQLLGGVDRSQILPNVALPVLPRALSEFCKHAEDPKSSPASLAKIVETDGTLTCELLKYVNSSRFGLSRQISSVQQALSLAGVKQTKLLLMSAGVRLATASRESQLINIRNFWNTNLERALLAREIAKLLKADAELAFAAGLLQDFLLPIITNEKLDDYMQFLTSQDVEPREVTGWESRRFGWTHAYAGGALMFDWAFPDELICAVLLHHRGLALLADPQLNRTAAAAAAVASLLPDALRQTPDGFDQLVRLEIVWPAFRLLPTAEKLKADFDAMAPGSGYEMNLLRRCQELATAVA
jgi:serine/threonine-protein kinase